MRCSLEHLKSFIAGGLDLDAKTIGQELTLLGLELESINPVAKDFSGVVIGEIISAEKHPDADKLQVCKVNINNSDNLNLLQIVCGAKNARAGLKVAVAKVGAVLPGDFKIKEAKLRGVASSGMLCSSSELGLTESSEGILELPEEAPVGQDLRIFLELNDQILEFELTPNRGDCASVLGLARELSILTHKKLKFPEIQKIQVLSDKTVTVLIENPEDCPKYLGRVIENINPNAKTPLWLENKLTRMGQKSIHPVVDVLNYVMLTLGQPMHAFDLDRIEGKISVRRAHSHGDEKLVLLDQREVNLKNNQLVISDDHSAIAIAGIMGGLSTAVNDSTKNIFIEAAHFSIQAISGQARALGLNTEASYRFERGVDPHLPEIALDLAVEYLIKIVGGSVGSLVSVIHSEFLPKIKKINLRLGRIEKILGMTANPIDPVETRKILESLGCRVEALVSSKLGELGELGEFIVEVPSYRFDLNIEEDLIEEIARIRGLDSLSPSLPLSFVKPVKSDESKISTNTLKNYFVSRGYHEAITYSFISPKIHELVLGQEADLNSPEKLKNPISEDLSLMRTSLIPGLLHAAGHNLSRQANQVKLFEFGRVFIKKLELEKIAGVIAGRKYLTNPHENLNVDFYDLKADLEGLLVDAEFIRSERSFLHPGRSAEILKNKKSVGYLGQIHPRVQKVLDFRMPVYVFECDLLALQDRPIPMCRSISKFPEISRDIALVLAADVSADKIIAAVKSLGGEALQGVSVFDVYQGDKIAEGKKSLALNLILQTLSHTLTDDEVQRIMKNILEGLAHQFNAALRE